MDAQVRQVAARFLKLVSAETKLPVIVCDERATIVEAADRSRIGTVHAGAQRILAAELDEYAVTAEEARSNPLVKEGVSVLIAVDGHRAGTFGITGPLALARPVARISALVLGTWMKEARQQSMVRETADRVISIAGDVSTRVERAGRETTGILDEMTRAAQAASEKMTLTDVVVRTVHEIAQKSRILSINGSVEAARAGDSGRAFAVVAHEMLELAESARSAAAQIQATLSEAKASMGALRAALDLTSGLAREQRSAMDEMKETVRAMEASLSDLARTPRT